MASTEIQTKPLPEFARMFAVAGGQIGWLFGAGTSASAGIPTATQLLDEFKAILYASECSLERVEVRMSDPLVADRVRRFFDNAHGVPPLGDPEEYAVVFELAYPDPAVRRQWLDQWIALGRPSYGHRVIAALMAAGLMRWIATTNFDDLVERGYEQLRARDESLGRMTIAALDSVERGSRALREEDWPLLIKLHGDIASERLKNTSDELRAQDATLRRAVLDASRTNGLAVIGNSGRDISMMETLRAAIAEEGAFARGFFWLTSDPANVLPTVRELMRDAVSAGIDARFIESANFDETFGVLARHAALSDVLTGYLCERQPPPRLRGVVLDSTEGGRFPALRLNGLGVIDLPKTAIHVRCQRQIEERPGVLLKEIGIPGFGVASGRDFYGYGLANIWQRALARYGPESIGEVSITVDPESPNLTIVGLLNEAVARALAWDRPLRPVFRRRGHHLVVWPDLSDETGRLFAPLVSAYGGAPLTGTFEGERTWREGVRIRLDWRLDRVWLLFEPWTFVDPPRRVEGEERKSRSRFAPPDAAAAWVKERWATRRNEVWAAALGAWADLLVGDETATFSAPFIENSSLVGASFTIGRQTAYSLPAAKTTGSGR